MKFNDPVFDKRGLFFIVLIFIFAFPSFQLAAQSSTNSPEYEV
jgi:hypothetical protein